MSYKICNSEKLLQYADLLVEQNAIIGLDTETQGLFPLVDKVVGFSFSWKPGFAVYVPVLHNTGQNCPLDVCREFFERIKGLRIVMHNAKFDKAMIFCSFGKNIPVFADTMLYAAILSEPKGLKDLSLKFLNIPQKHFSTLMEEKFGKSWSKQGMTVQDISADDTDLLDYAACDADYTLQIFYKLYPKMSPYKNIVKIEENLLDQVVSMNLIGAPVDVDMLNKATVDFEEGLDNLYEDICNTAGKPIQINSPRELSAFLFGPKEDGGLNLPVIERSAKTGTPSTSKEVLEELSDLHPAVAKVKQWREDSRLLKAYIKKIPAGLDDKGRIHSEFDNLGAVSGRFTSSGVEDHNGVCRGLNLQNIPKKNDRGIDMRAAFIAPKGWSFVKADYSQVEYRVMGNLSGEKYIIDSFNAGLDFHTATAAKMFDVAPDAVSKDQRAQGKVFNFGLSYGMTAKGLAQRLGCSEEEAERKMEEYFSHLPKLVDCINATKAAALQNGYTQTFFGRRRPLDLKMLPQQARDKMLRKSFNTMVQGTAAELLKIAILRVRNRILQNPKYKGHIQLLMTVHDELDFIVDNSMLEELLVEIKRAMEIPMPENWCRLVCDVEYGPDWSEDSHKLFEPSSDIYTPDTFTSWKDILPEGIKSSLDAQIMVPDSAIL